ncbi:MAG: S41 family peptidase [Bacteroides graminisolvens]
MNIKRTFAIVFFAVALPFFFYSCSKDDDEIVTTPTEEEEEEDPVVPTETVYSWIESEMREKYYWYSEIPAASSLNYKLGVADFFESLLSSKDGKHNDSSDYFYSYIKSTADVSASTRGISQIDYSYGFEFQLYKVEGSVDYYVHILYVAPSSPAAEAGLKRGDWIHKIDAKAIDNSNYTTLLGGNAVTLSVANYKSASSSWTNIRTINITSARTIEDDPLYYHNVYTSSTGKKVGYLVYNHFTADKDENKGDGIYDTKLLSWSKDFAGVDEFILDLRYNNGGLISCAQLLATILAPSDALGSIFCIEKFNGKSWIQKKSNLYYNSNLVKNGINLNLKTIYVLVTGMTASASELVINGLKPYANVILIGTKTEGKNVGSITIEDESKYDWYMQPIVCKLYNAEDKSDYEDGMTVNYELDEGSIQNMDSFLELGDTNELLLNAALSIIDGNYKTSALSRSSWPTFRKAGSSLDRKASNGVIINTINNAEDH